MVANRIVKDFKALLFDLTLSMKKNVKTNLIQGLVNNVQAVIEVKQVSIFMNHQWDWTNNLDTYHSNTNHQSVSTLAEKALDDFNQLPPVQTISATYEQFHLLKLNCNDHYYGVMIMECLPNAPVDEQVLKTVAELMTTFLGREYAKREQQYFHKRMQCFFELSTELQAIHDTAEILKGIKTAFKTLYPLFSFSLLMSQDYGSEDLPIELMEYSSEKISSPGTTAFIDNKIKIDTLPNQNKMHLYSPLAGKQGIYGVLEIIIPRIIDVSELELDLIEQFSRISGMAIERTILVQSSNKQISNLQMINHASHELNINLERSDIIHIVKKYILETSEAAEFAIVIYDDTKTKATINPYEILDGSTPFFSSEQGKAFIRHLYGVFKSDSDSILSGDFQASYKESPHYSLIANPMWTKETILGFIVAAHPAPYYFTLDKFKFIQSFVQHASLAFQNSLLTEQLHKMATTDYLTKLYSRSYLDEKVTEHMEGASSGTFALFDIDDFKYVNDTYGHYVGDQVLVSTAKVIQKEVSTVDGIAARWGGEEFALYLPKLDFERAINKINRIRNKVYQLTDPPVTLSCGITEWKRGSTNSSIETLFIRADEALYEAKLSGKNKTVTKPLS